MAEESNPPQSDSSATAGRVHPLVRPCVVLSDAFNHLRPVGFFVFAHNGDEVVFPDERSARDFANDQAEDAWMEMDEDSVRPGWPIYALWPTDWPNARAMPPATESDHGK